jgi:hypothetical protein
LQEKEDLHFSSKRLIPFIEISPFLFNNKDSLKIGSTEDADAGDKEGRR